MKKPNIFYYAKKELSQDAMICYLLACLNSRDITYRKVGIDFIRFLFDDNSIDENDVKLENESPHPQYAHMDVYAVLYLRNKLYPIIFENKTHTFLHDGQFLKYCKKVANWMYEKSYFKNLSERMNVLPHSWGNIKYIYFKTGYPFGWQKECFKKETAAVKQKLQEKNISIDVKEIYLHDMVKFLETHQIDEILKDYYKALKVNSDKQNFAVKNWFIDMENCEKSLSENFGSKEAACSLLYEKCFGENCEFHYDHQGWASKDLFATNIFEADKKIYYGFRFDYCSYLRGKWAYAFQFYQYRDEKNKNTTNKELEYKTIEAKEIQQLCKNIITKIQMPQIVIKYEDLKDYPCKIYSDQKIIKIFLLGESSPIDICEFIKTFSNEICNTIKSSKENTEIFYTN